MRYNHNTKVLYLSDGSRYDFSQYETNSQPPVSYVLYFDRNGNRLKFDALTGLWTDTLNRTNLKSPPLDNSTPGDKS